VLPHPSVHYQGLEAPQAPNAGSSRCRGRVRPLKALIHSWLESRTRIFRSLEVHLGLYTFERNGLWGMVLAHGVLVLTDLSGLQGGELV
jgi:hypothetical protein